MESPDRNRDASFVIPPMQFTPDIGCGHVVLFYKESGFLLNEVSQFIGTAFSSGNPVIIIAIQEHRDDLADRLYRQGVDIGEIAQSGRFIEIDANEALSEILVNGVPDPERFNKLIGGLIAHARESAKHDQPVALYDEMASLLCQAGGTSSAIQLEQLWNEFADAHPISLCCSYSLESFPGLEGEKSYQRICAEHSAIVPGDGYSPLSSIEPDIGERTTDKDAREHLAESILESQTFLRHSSLPVMRSEEERRRIGGDLLDGLGQSLAALKVKLDSLPRFSGDCESKSQEEVEQCLNLVDKAVKEVQAISDLLSPPPAEGEGLKSAIPRYLDGFTKRSGIETTYQISVNVRALSDHASEAIFQVLQEALANVHRHSGGSVADVQLMTKNNFIVLKISDNGGGIPSDILNPNGRDLSPMGAGLRQMSERLRFLGGRLEISTSADGATITASIPAAVSAAAMSA